MPKCLGDIFLGGSKMQEKKYDPVCKRCADKKVCDFSHNYALCPKRRTLGANNRLIRSFSNFTPLVPYMSSDQESAKVTGLSKDQD